MPMTRSRRGSPREHRRFSSALAACRSTSPADTLAMISAACAQLGERALVCAGWTDFSRHPAFRARQGGGRGELRGHLPGLPRGRASRWRGHHGRGPARRSPHVDPFDRPRSDALGGTGQTTEGGHRPALFEHNQGIADGGPAHDPCPAICLPGTRGRYPDDQTRRMRARPPITWKISPA